MPTTTVVAMHSTCTQVLPVVTLPVRGQPANNLGAGCVLNVCPLAGLSVARVCVSTIVRATTMRGQKQCIHKVLP